MKALTLEILWGGFLPPNTFSLLLKAICTIANRQGVKYFLKTHLCFCGLAKKGSFSCVHLECSTATWRGMAIAGCVGQLLFVWWLYRKPRLGWMSKIESIVLDLFTSVFVWICWRRNSCLIFLMLMLRVFSRREAKQNPAHCLCSHWGWGLELDMVLQVELIWPTGNRDKLHPHPQKTFFHLSHCKWT